MKTIAAVWIAASLFAGHAAFAADTWNVDPDHSSAQFAVKHLSVSTVRGELGKVSGTLVYDEKDVTKSKVDCAIDVKALNTREEKRDNHLRSDAFFDVEHFPSITFVSTKVQKVSKGKLKITGDLTIRGKTKATVLDVDFPATAVEADGDTHLGAMATTTINRQDFGVAWNTSVSSGGLLVGDDVKVTIDMDFIKSKTAAPAAAASPAPSTKPATTPPAGVKTKK